MSGIAWEHVRQDLRELAEAVCTPRQLDALRYRAAGYGPTETAERMGINQPAVTRLFDRAAERIRAAMECPNTKTGKVASIG